MQSNGAWRGSSEQRIGTRGSARASPWHLLTPALEEAAIGGAQQSLLECHQVSPHNRATPAPPFSAARPSVTARACRRRTEIDQRPKSGRRTDR
jgi:hypothetical protein